MNAPKGLLPELGRVPLLRDPFRSFFLHVSSILRRLSWKTKFGRHLKDKTAACAKIKYRLSYIDVNCHDSVFPSNMLFEES